MLLLSSVGVAAPATQPTKFLRYVEAPDGSARLEVAEAAYKNAAGVDVHLIGAVHIADPGYYAGLNESFEHYDALLYEMVKPAAPATQPADGALAQEQEEAQVQQSSLAWVGGLQRFLRDQLDLVYQLDAIDYNRPNFVHADLDLKTFEKLQADRGESMLGLMLRSAMANMNRDTPGSDVSGLELLGALMSPDKATELKRVLAQQFGDLDEQMEAINGPNGSVILTERNKVALRVLRQQIAAGKKYIGIFYGAGHLQLMEESLEKSGFHKVGVVWRTAWYISPPVVPATRPVGQGH